MRTNIQWSFLFLLALAACGASDDDPPAETVRAEAPARVAYADARADKFDWQVEGSSAGLTVGPSLEPVWSPARTAWRMRGRSEQPLADARAYTAEGRIFETHRADSHSFTVLFDEPAIVDVLAGTRVLLELTGENGEVVHAMARFEPRLTGSRGNPNIEVSEDVVPVRVGRALHFRGRVRCEPGYHLERIFTDDEADPAITDEHGSWRFDWTPQLLLLAADLPEHPVYFVAKDSADTPRRKRAHVELRLVQLGLTTDDPRRAWPTPTCEPEVLDCLQQLDESNFDTETCGHAPEVEACFGDVEVPEGATEQDFVEDFRQLLEELYTDDEETLREDGGVPLEEALEAIDPARVRRVDDIEEGEYFRYDPNYYDIFYHPDVVRPGSARIWYGAYEPSGRLVRIWPVN